MKKIDIKPYIISFVQEGKKIEAPFNVRDSIITILFMPSLKLNAVELLRQNDLAEKISKTEGDDLLLEESEYEQVKRSITEFEGFTKEHVEFVKRILNADTVKVSETK